ncbi:Crp/Fnr family transcriptional regulator [Vogesella facilis]|uniref:Crp/Fnr family transcriptional regulator n=1 Tax=Vogesella facilis TaxID=1655232 RepID=A0ABV7RET9_9NEIS
MPPTVQPFCQNGDTSPPATLASSPWYAAAPAELQLALQALGRPRSLDSGQFLFHRGAAADGLYCLLAGSMRISCASRLGKEAPLARLQPGDWFGELALFDDGPRTHDAIASQPCTLWQLPHAALQDWLQQRPAHWRHLGLLLADKTRRLMQGLAQQTLLDIPSRLAQRLWLLSSEQQPELALSQEELAGMLGISRQSCNAALQTLAASGLLQLARGRIRIVSRQALAEFGRL